jgi:rhodanese-related sulfurtransferase
VTTATYRAADGLRSREPRARARARAGSDLDLRETACATARADQDEPRRTVSETTGRPEAPLVDAETAGRAVAGGALFVDVRSDAGRAAAGGLPQAVVVAKTEVAQRFAVGEATAVPGLTGKDQPIVVICGSPAGSGPVTAELLAAGFTDVVHVDGGFPAWKAAGLTVGEPARA